MFVRFAAKIFIPGREPLIISIIDPGKKKENLFGKGFYFWQRGSSWVGRYWTGGKQNVQARGQRRHFAEKTRYRICGRICPHEVIIDNNNLLCEALDRCPVDTGCGVVGMWGCWVAGLRGCGVVKLWGCGYRNPFLCWTEEFSTTRVHFWAGQKNSLLQESIAVLDKRILYYRSPCLCCTREFFTAGVHVCTGQENALLQESISVSDNRLLYYRSPFLYCYDVCGQPSYRTESMKLKSAT